MLPYDKRKKAASHFHLSTIMIPLDIDKHNFQPKYLVFTVDIVDKSVDGSKRAELSYQVLDSRVVENQPVSLVKIQLHTGRHHQIRVQFAGHGTPLWGDGKYGEKVSGRQLALWSWKLSFIHPVSQKVMDFTAAPKGGILKQFLEG